jgi:hypothetical protein
MANFGGTLNIQNKLYYVIAEFILTTFEAGSSFMHAKLEDINFLSRESIVFSKNFMETQKAMEHYELSKRHLCLGKNPQL